LARQNPGGGAGGAIASQSLAQRGDDVNKRSEGARARRHGMAGKSLAVTKGEPSLFHRSVARATSVASGTLGPGARSRRGSVDLSRIRRAPDRASPTPTADMVWEALSHPGREKVS